MNAIIDSKLELNQQTFFKLFKKSKLITTVYCFYMAHFAFFLISDIQIRPTLQPIMGLTEYMNGKLKYKKHSGLFDSLITSGQKLNILTENILDVSSVKDHFLT